MYVNNPEFLSRAQKIYPGAYALEVDRLGAVWVKCDPCQWDHRDIPGGAAPSFGPTFPIKRMKNDPPRPRHSS
jgi:hypothetical protein